MRTITSCAEGVEIIDEQRRKAIASAKFHNRVVKEKDEKIKELEATLNLRDKGNAGLLVKIGKLENEVALMNAGAYIAKGVIANMKKRIQEIEKRKHKREPLASVRKRFKKEYPYYARNLESANLFLDDWILFVCGAGYPRNTPFKEGKQ